jgi:hypothetical protein
MFIGQFLSELEQIKINVLSEKVLFKNKSLIELTDSIF